jgi:hypothetical protein
VTVIDHVQELWTGLLGFLGHLVIPDWGALIGLLPIFLVLGVIGPIATILMLVWFIYVVRRPRTSTEYVEGPRRAPLDEAGRPVFPVGLPHCLREGLIYSTGTQRCPNDGDELWVVCPMCGLGRSAGVDTCGECGLILKVQHRDVALGPIAAPPPGGAAVA